MKKKIAILTLHGMGETPENYWHDLAGKLKRNLGAEVWQSLHIEPVYYQPVMQDNQYRVWHDIPDSFMRWKDVRKFMLYGFSDAACIEHQAQLPNSVYAQVQSTIRKALRHTLEQVESASSPVVVIAQSLGCQVISNYIWDAQVTKGIWAHHPGEDDPAEVDFLKLKTTRYLFTTGCNIPLFVSGQGKIEAIQRPNREFEWFNYFDEDDVLGWPLKQMSDSYHHVVTEDVRINAGSLFESWNPACHNGYWTDGDFIRPVANKIQALYGAVQSAKSPLYANLHPGRVHLPTLMVGVS